MTRRYTKAEIEFVVKSKEKGLVYEEIAAALRTTKNSVRHQWQYYQMMRDPVLRERYLEKRKQQKTKNGLSYRYKSTNDGLVRYYADQKVIIPPEVLAERDASFVHPRTLSMILFGDPIPIRSALGRECKD